MLKIEPEDEYGNYIASCLRVTKERKNKVTPQFKTNIPDLSEYDVILLGYPVWAQDVPAFVADFVLQCDLKGKTVIPFVTFGMSGVSWTMKTLRKICKNANIAYPYDYGVFKKDNYEKWIENVKGLLK